MSSPFLSEFGLEENRAPSASGGSGGPRPALLCADRRSWPAPGAVHPLELSSRSAPEPPAPSPPLCSAVSRLLTCARRPRPVLRSCPRSHGSKILESANISSTLVNVHTKFLGTIS